MCFCLTFFAAMANALDFSRLVSDRARLFGQAQPLGRHAVRPASRTAARRARRALVHAYPGRGPPRKIGLANLVHNMRRLLWLERQTALT